MYPSARIDFLTLSTHWQVHENSPYINTIYRLEKASQTSFTQIVKQLKKNQYDLVLDAHNSLRSNLITWKLAPLFNTVPQIRKLNRFSLLRMAQVKWHLFSDNKIPPRRETYLALLKSKKLLASYTELFPSSQDQDLINKLMVNTTKPIIALAPGAAHMPKCWHEDYFVSLIHMLAKAGYQPYLVGGQSDVPTFRIHEKTKAISTNLAGKLSIMQTAAFLQNALLTVCNDSAITHCSEAVGTPCFTIFGPTKNMGFSPFLPSSRIFSTNLPCRPCSHHGKIPCKLKDPDTYACLNRITPDFIFQSICTWHSSLAQNT